MQIITIDIQDVLKRRKSVFIAYSHRKEADNYL